MSKLLENGFLRILNELKAALDLQNVERSDAEKGATWRKEQLGVRSDKESEKMKILKKKEKENFA